MWAKPVSLRGEYVSAVPLRQEHAADLAEAVADGDLHRLWYTMIPAPEDVPAEIDRPSRVSSSHSSSSPVSLLPNRPGQAGY